MSVPSRKALPNRRAPEGDQAHCPLAGCARQERTHTATRKCGLPKCGSYFPEILIRPPTDLSPLSSPRQGSCGAYGRTGIEAQEPAASTRSMMAWAKSSSWTTPPHALSDLLVVKIIDRCRWRSFTTRKSMSAGTGVVIHDGHMPPDAIGLPGRPNLRRSSEPAGLRAGDQNPERADRTFRNPQPSTEMRTRGLLSDRALTW